MPGLAGQATPVWAGLSPALSNYEYLDVLESRQQLSWSTSSGRNSTRSLIQYDCSWSCDSFCFALLSSNLTLRQRPVLALRPALVGLLAGPQASELGACSTCSLPRYEHGVVAQLLSVLQTPLNAGLGRPRRPRLLPLARLRLRLQRRSFASASGRRGARSGHASVRCTKSPNERAGFARTKPG